MNRREHGIALVVVLSTTLVVAVLLTVGSLWVVSGLKGNTATSQRNYLVQLADGVSDQARIQVVYRYQTTKLNTRNYLQGLQSEIGQPNTVALADGSTAVWAIKRVSSITDRYGWVDLHATVRNGSAVQTVVRRVSFGDNQVFNLAMLAETTNCMYCHLKVNGDVGSLDFLRPGWGTENQDGHGSGGSDGGSTINGDLYVAPKKGDLNATNVSTNDAANVDPQDPTKTTKINGAIVKGKLNLKYSGNMLPDDMDNDGIPDFPAIDRDTAMANATGLVSGGSRKIGVARGGTYAANAQALGTVNGTYDGNLVLEGTQANPLVLNGDIYATGDVIIKGYVTGRGAIYSGRNTYVAGDLITANPPSTPGEGVCGAFPIGSGDSAAQRNDKNNLCAQANVAAGKDEVRIGARGNTVLGDYTERTASGEMLPYDQRQSADYYRAQFGLGGNNTDFYFDRVTGDELSKKPDGTFKTVDDRIVSSGNVVTAKGSPSLNPSADAYSYAMRPGSIAGNGSFTSWMDDTTYRTQMLGTQAMTFNSWRADLGGKNNKEKLSDYLQRQLPQLTASGLSTALATTVLTKIFDGGNADYADANMTVNIQNKTIRVMVNASRPYAAQVKRVDAFLYSNRRVAGKTSMSPLAVNGGMIGKEIGILAPGRTRPWWVPNNDTFKEIDSRSSACGPSSGYAVPGTEDCGFTVNYDYRLRNGGYGYNLVTGNVGQTMTWKIADAVADQVSP